MEKEDKEGHDKLEKLTVDMLEAAKECDDAHVAALLRDAACILTIVMTSLGQKKKH